MMSLKSIGVGVRSLCVLLAVFSAVPALADAPVLTDVPSYYWSYGCSPTSGMMVYGYPTWAGAYSGRGSVWVCKGESQKAMEDYREAVELDPGNAEAYTLQRLLIEAAFHHNREDFQEAIARASEALELEPACIPAYAARAVAYWYTEHHVQAVDDYTKILEMAGESYFVLNARGQVYAEMGEFENALTDLNRALEIGEKTELPTALAYALSGRALAKAGLGWFDEASKDFEDSIGKCPANAWVHYNHGLTYHQLGNAPAATTCFELALELHEPSLPPRKRDRARGYLRRYRQTES